VGQSQIGELTPGAQIIGNQVVYPATGPEGHRDPSNTI
jgi:hypothetical protein